MIIGLSLIFGIMAIFLLMGKGGFLIAGYNTASESEKARYDEKKLCRVMGVGMMLIAFGLLATAFFKMIGVVIMLITIALALVVMFVGSGHCYREEYQKEVAKTPWYKNSQVYFAIIGILVSIGVGIMMFIGNINVKFLDQSVVFKATLSRTTEVVYQDIEKVSYVESLDIGKKKMGINNMAINAGRFQNDKFGRYLLYCYTSCKDYVVMETKDGIVVVNDKTVSQTKALYEKLKDK